jgi:cell division protease FtsH
MRRKKDKNFFGFSGKTLKKIGKILLLLALLAIFYAVLSSFSSKSYQATGTLKTSSSPVAQQSARTIPDESLLTYGVSPEILPEELSFEEFLALIDQGLIDKKSITITKQDDSSKITAVVAEKETVTGKKVSFFAYQGSYLEKRMLEELEKRGIYPKAESPSGGFNGWFFIFPPIILLIILYIYWARRSAGGEALGGLGGGQQIIPFLKNKARLLKGGGTVTFNDVAGVEEAKESLQEVVEFLKYPKKFKRVGAKIPKGVLLVGPPGTGKTLLARAVAGEAGVPFFSVSGSAFVEMFVGVGASRVRDLFSEAKKNAPCILFIDELDAVGRHRGAGLGGSHDEREQTLNQILVEMDGFDEHTNIVVIAATNRPDILDPALIRPGRFDRRAILDRPDLKARKAILDVHIKDKPLHQDVDLWAIARQTPGFCGADLANLVNEAAILAARRNQTQIRQQELLESIDKVLFGPERKSIIISEKEKRITAFHEAGHALTGWVLPNVDPLHKITIVPRGMAGGYTVFLPEEDKHLWSESQLKDRIAATFGGLAAEEKIFGEHSTGAEDDLKRVREIVRKMVMRYGMLGKEDLAPQAFGKTEEMVFLGKEIHEPRDYSEETAQILDRIINQIISEALEKTRAILDHFEEKLKEVAQVLMEQETLEGEELESLFGDVPKNKWPLED